MTPGGYDFLFDGPTTPNTIPVIVEWWARHWGVPVFVETLTDTETLITRSPMSIDEMDMPYEGLIHVIIEPQRITFVVDITDANGALECIDFLAWLAGRTP